MSGSWVPIANMDGETVEEILAPDARCMTNPSEHHFLSQPTAELSPKMPPTYVAEWLYTRAIGVCGGYRIYGWGTAFKE